MNHDSTQSSQLSSHRVGSVGEITPDLRRDLELVEQLPFASKYSEFVHGNWAAFILANPSGSESDGLFRTDGNSMHVTELGRRLPAIMQLVRDRFDLTHLRWVRVFAMQSGMLMSHRDFVEFETSRLRLNLPLQTQTTSLHSEEGNVFHMGEGEVWFLDASRTHAAIASASAMRINLCLDFDLPAADPRAPLLPVSRDEPGRRRAEPIARKPLPPELLSELGERIGKVRSVDDVQALLWEAFSWHFSFDVRNDAHFDALAQALLRRGRDDEARVVRDYRRYCIERRALGESFSWRTPERVE